MSRPSFALALLGAGLLAACDDPVRAREIEELGGEDPNVRRGPLHRPGQPCLLCHGEDGSVEPTFSFAGTVFQKPGARDPLRDAVVRLIDSSGQQYAVRTNCAGNFYIGADNFAPRWPVWVKVEYGEVTAEMVSSTTREGSCGACHADPASPSTVGHVYLVEDDVEFSQGRCR